MSYSPLFRDRAEAGQRLAQLVYSEIGKLDEPQLARNPIVYALPRGGLPIAAPIARLLGCPLHVVLAKKITRPENPELAIGAVTADGYVVWSPHCSFRKISAAQRQAALEKARSKAEEQLAQFSPLLPKIDPEGALAIVVDDGIATGMTMLTAVQALRAQKPSAVWICAPVAPPDILPFLGEWADRVLVLATPEPFLSVSRFYVEFPQLDMNEALTYLKAQNAWLSP
ncbi:MAG: phosphoribosyltransferase family protein [Oscillatoriaceae bacterium SKW80]|nr:phosphoribosyltransferase family protein [Oscillatoriaceae bacterium SKYG93]MCX8119950.1 phosphoribosyltransferase family protein [Oscillatoriaceae bacterium SKW80]MDW8454111.1 phosphoribosyltransferase family protein [Oscillatoriaceae cyanobacterium SKYGB_i_bin93]HIK29574.1 phosphoribosyltransferase [Oscillatoriaceae cyanobacterium M7585_C2015_266]